MAVLIQQGGPTMLVLLALAAPAIGLAIARLRERFGGRLLADHGGP